MKELQKRVLIAIHLLENNFMENSIDIKFI